MLSLPSHDREAWYDSGPAGYSSLHALDDVDASFANTARLAAASDPLFAGHLMQDGDIDYATAYTQPNLTNRGNKLHPGAKHVRKGRLGGWENYEIFESKSTFPSNNSYPLHATSTFPNPSLSGPSGSASSGLRGAHADRRLPSNTFPITPSLTLVPSNSCLAVRQNKLASHNQSADRPGNADHTTTPRKRKRFHNYDHLASTSCSAAGYTTGPVRAYLPMPPQNPVELVASPFVSRTFSPKNRTLEKLGLSATDLIEQDIPLVKSLTRLVDFLRGTAIAGADGLIGLPFSSEDEAYVTAAEQAIEPEEAMRKDVNKVKVNGDAASPNEAAAEQPVENEGAVSAHATDASAATSTGDAVAAIETDVVKPNGISGPSETAAKDDEHDTMAVDGADEAAAAEADNIALASGATSAPTNGAATDMAIDGADQLPAAEVNGDAAPAEQNGTDADDSNEQEPEAETALILARPPPAIRRIADPVPYVASLFVTPGVVTVPTKAGTGESHANATEAVISQTAATHTQMDEQAQKQALEACVRDLTKFLADSLEYQDRLGEIRDSVLGIDKRRKGAWTIARAYAHQLLWEEGQE